MEIKLIPLSRYSYQKKEESGLEEQIAEFQKKEILTKASKLHFTLKILPKTNEWIEIEVIDGHNKSHKLQVLDNKLEKVYCNCNEFLGQGLLLCAHSAALRNFANNWREYETDKNQPNPTEFVIAKNLWVKELKTQIASVPFPLNNYKTPISVHNSFLGKTFLYGKQGASDLRERTIIGSSPKVNTPNLISIPENNVNYIECKDLLIGISLYDYQKTILQKLITIKRAICSMAMGLGKANSLDTKILTPTGWTTMHQLKIDDKIIGKNGFPTKVTGVFPQGEKEIYKVVFSDGSSTECCDEHLWAVNTPRRRWKGKDWLIKPLKEIKNNLIDAQGNRCWAIPMVDAVQFTNQPINIDPYLLGVLIGDGSMSTKSSVTFTTADDFMVNKCKNLLPCSSLTIKQESKYDFRISRITTCGPIKTNKLIDSLRLLDLMSKKSNQKFIPDCYKYNLPDIRLKLLQGLMDTDGFISKNGDCCIYYTTSEQLAKDVQEIVWSLGGKAIIANKQTQYTYKEVKQNGLPSFAINISLPANIIPVTLPRKLERFKPKTKYPPVRYIDKVELIGKKQTQCISVDAEDHLYVVDNYIVTHNTLTAIGSFSYLKNSNSSISMLVVCPKSLKLQWEQEINRVFEKDSVATYVINKKSDIAAFYTEVRPKAAMITYQSINRYLDEFIKHGKVDVVIADEIQVVRNNETKVWKSLSKIQSEYFFGLSGTVIENRLDDLYNVMEIVNPGLLGPKWRFDYTYQNLKGITKTKILYSGVKNVEALKQKLSGCVFGYDKVDLPEKQHFTTYVDLDKKCRTKHDEFLFEADKLISKSLNTELTFGEKAMLQAYMLKARQCCNSEELISKRQPKDQPMKIIEFLELVKKVCIDKNEKLVVFSEWTQMLDILAREVNIAYGFVGSVLYTGEKSAKQRQTALKQFQADISCKIFFSSDVGGVGLDGLQLVCHNMLHFELPWNPAKLDQRTGRIHRILQKNPVNIYQLVANDSIEQRIESLLTSKRDIRTQTLKVE